MTVALAVGLLLTTMAGIGPTTADEGGADFGTYERLWTVNDLTESHVTVSEGSVFIDAPSLTSELRVNAPFLNETLGAWGAQTEFATSGAVLTVSGGSATFVELELGEESLFTWGHASQVEFLERPMWISAQQPEYGDAITLSMDDGDAAGQSIYVSKEWLWAREIAYPAPVHEDGTNLTVVASEDRNGYIIDVHHFSDVIINPDGLTVLGRQSGLTFPHPDGSKWYPDDQRLEIPVGNQLSDYAVLAGKDWVDFHIPDLTLETFSWEVEEYDGNDYYLVELTPADTPTAVSFRPFSLTEDILYSRGSIDTLRLTFPALISVDTSIGGLNLTFAEGVNVPVLYLTFNATWVTTALGVDRPDFRSSEGRVHGWEIMDYQWLQVGVPSSSTWIMLGQSNDPDGPGFGFIDGLVGTLELGEACEKALGENAEVETFQHGPSRAGIYVSGTSFCFEWKLDHYRADFYNVVIGLTDGQNEVKCGTGEETSTEYQSQESFRVCEWPDGEEFPTGTVYYHILGSAYWFEDPGDKAIGSYVACQASTVIVPAAALAGIVFAPAWGIAAGAAVSGAIACTAYTLEAEANIYDEDVLIGEEILVGSGERETLLGENSVVLEDENWYRGDTWNEVEYTLFRKSYYDGTQRIFWTLREIVGGELTYQTDISIVNDVQFNHDYVDFHYGAGGGSGEALVTTFPDSHEGSPNTEELVTRNHGGQHQLDWEAPGPECVLVERIVSIVGTLVLGPSDDPDPLCEGLQMLEGETNDEPWIRFSLESHDLDPESIQAWSGAISVNEVLAEDGNITRAVAKKLVADSQFVDGISHVGVNTGTSGSCDKITDIVYEPVFKAIVSGSTMAGHLPADQESVRIPTICFETLFILGVLV